MLSPRDIEIFLPKYLTPETEQKLFRDLAQFPDNIDDRMYRMTDFEPDVIYQGDGINDLLVVELPSLRTKNAPFMVLSNTCDIDPTNQRLFSANLIYTPIIRLSNYRDWLLRSEIRTKDDVENHLDSIRHQQLT